MKYVEALEEYKPQPGEISLFLGGGISNCENWQTEIVQLLEKFNSNLVILNPRRKHFPMDDLSATASQIDWEFRHLNMATMILFWFAPETLCPITLFEYGKWLVRNKPLFVGHDPNYTRKEDVLIQTKYERPFLRVVDSIQELASQVIHYTKQIDHEGQRVFESDHD